MSDTKYAYAVARIRALENGLFSSAQIEQLLSVKSYEGALRFLTEHGWGDADTPLSAEAILTREKTKTWETVRDLLKGDDAILAVLSYGDLYHNLKAAIKDAAAPGSHGNVYFDDCEVDGVRMAKIVAEKDWQALPAHMREAAKEASETFLHTSDGQLCDIIVDRAALAAIYECGKNASDAIIRDYEKTHTDLIYRIPYRVGCGIIRLKHRKALVFRKFFIHDTKSCDLLRRLSRIKCILRIEMIIHLHFIQYSKYLRTGIRIHRRAE